MTNKLLYPIPLTAPESPQLRSVHLNPKHLTGNILNFTRCVPFDRRRALQLSFSAICGALMYQVEMCIFYNNTPPIPLSTLRSQKATSNIRLKHRSTLPPSLSKYLLNGCAIPSPRYLSPPGSCCLFARPLDLCQIYCLTQCVKDMLCIL